MYFDSLPPTLHSFHLTLPPACPLKQREEKPPSGGQSHGFFNLLDSPTNLFSSRFASSFSLYAPVHVRTPRGCMCKCVCACCTDMSQHDKAGVSLTIRHLFSTLLRPVTHARLPHLLLLKAFSGCGSWQDARDRLSDIHSWTGKQIRLPLAYFFQLWGKKLNKTLFLTENVPRCSDTLVLPRCTGMKR